VTCEGCLLFSSNGSCGKLNVLTKLQAKHVENKKVILFLNFQVSRIDKVHCKDKYDDSGAYEQFLQKRLAWVNCSRCLSSGVSFLFLCLCRLLFGFIVVLRIVRTKIARCGVVGVIVLNKKNKWLLFGGAC
jgi:hypothetical protein